MMKIRKLRADEIPETKEQLEIMQIKQGMNFHSNLLNEINISVQSIIEVLSNMDESFKEMFTKTNLRKFLEFYLFNKHFALKHANPDNIVYITQYFNGVIEQAKKNAEKAFPDEANQIIIQAELNSKASIEATEKANPELSKIEQMKPDSFTEV